MVLIQFTNFGTRIASPAFEAQLQPKSHPKPRRGLL